MTSNALSSRRGPLRRPKVCKSLPNPGRCDPPPRPPLQSCAVELDESPPFYTDDIFDMKWRACRTDRPPSQMLTPLVAALHGNILNISSGENCTTGNNIRYQAPSYATAEQVSMLVSWGPGTLCYSTVHFDIVEEHDDD